MNLCSDPSCRRWGAEYLRRQGKQLRTQLAGVPQAGNVEFIHRARVASRRLRAGLQIFEACLPPKPRRRWDRQIRRLTKGLGAARDLDVQRQYLTEALSQLTEASHGPGIARLLVRTDLARDQLQRRVGKALKRLEEGKVLQQMRRHVASLLELPEDAGRQPSPACFRLAQEHVSQRLQEMLALEEGLSDPSDCQQHHALRIAAKRLRYTVEICRPVYGDRLDGFLEAVKQLQAFLGEVHDSDVWIEQLPRMLEEERQWIVECYGHADPLDWLRPGVDFLLAQQRQRRQDRFAELVRFWQEQTSLGTWKKLGDLVQPAESSEEAVATRCLAGRSGDREVLPESPTWPARLRAAK